jgi:hypothetical protein
MLGEPVVERKLVGPRLLGQSRAALRRVSTLAGLHLLDGSRDLAERARREMLAAAAFSDWNPYHFLDVAEMTNALAIGYDWLHASLSEEDLATVRAAIVEKGLRPGLAVYDSGKGWPRFIHNWNQVCNGGLTAGALAIAGEEPALARVIIGRARESIVVAMRSFAPDGGWAEGPGYWNYATHYNVFFLSALETALGTDFGLKALPGFAETGLFRIHSTGPLGLTFNYADAAEGAGTAAQMLWLAAEFHRPEYARHEAGEVGKHPEIFHLLWYRKPESAQSAALPPDALFRGVDVAFFGGGRNDRQAAFAGFKGGNNRANHSQLDLGTFVFDALGERWAVDLGPDDYNLPDYFGKKRWDYYRLRTEGQNTLLIDGANQDPAAKAPLVAYLSSPARAFAVADLTAGYASAAKRVLRGVALLKRRQLLVEDEVDAPDPVGVVWNLHTRAAVRIEGPVARLSQGGKELEARILSPTDAHFEVVAASPPRPQRPDPELKRLSVILPEKTAGTRIAVLLAPAGEKPAATALEPLEAWVAAGKFER